jgi:hypothetical protein
MDNKIDRISQDIAIVKIKDVEQANKLNNLEEKIGIISTKYDDINERLRKLEEIPKMKVISKVEFIRKALLAGLTIFITGAVVGLGTYFWKLIVNLDTIIEVIERLK